MKLYKKNLLPLSLLLLAPVCSQQLPDSPSEQKKVPAPFKTIVQPKGKNSSYDRNVLHQNHLTTQRQNTKDQATPEPTLASQDRAIAQSSDQINANVCINTSARPPSQEALDVWVVGEALLWQATEENLTYVYSGTGPTQGNHRNLHTVDFNWDFGFRLGLGFNMPRDGWDISLQWTHIANHAEDTKHPGNNSSLFPVWEIDSVNTVGALSKAKANWKVHLDQIDFMLGKEYFIGRHLTFQPNVGARADWIFQEYDIKYIPLLFPGSVQRVDLQNNYFGFGFFGGINTDWLLGRGFSIYGMADFAILMGFFDISQKTHQVNTLGILQKGKDKISKRCGKSVFDLSLGLKWSRLYHKKSWGLTFKAGYEYHLFFDQNQFILPSGASFQRGLDTPFQPDGDLIYQGGTLSCQIDF